MEVVTVEVEVVTVEVEVITVEVEFDTVEVEVRQNLVLSKTVYFNVSKLFRVSYCQFLTVIISCVEISLLKSVIDNNC